MVGADDHSVYYSDQKMLTRQGLCLWLFPPKSAEKGTNGVVFVDLWVCGVI